MVIGPSQKRSHCSVHPLPETGSQQDALSTKFTASTCSVPKDYKALLFLTTQSTAGDVDDLTTYDDCVDNPDYNKSDHFNCGHFLFDAGYPTCPSSTTETASGEARQRGNLLEASPDSKTPEYKVLKRRWYVLLLYVMYTVGQVGVWNTFGPISGTAKLVFHWQQDTIALLNNLGPIAFVSTGIISSWVLNTRGIRVACLIASFFVATGSALRCITMENPMATRLMILAHFLNGVGGPIATSCGPKLSASWFACEERATATTIGAMALYMGLATSFVLGPQIVSSPDQPIIDVISNTTTLSSQINLEKSEKSVRLFFIIVAAWTSSVFLLILIYFPAKPPVPPSPSSTVNRENFIQGTKDLFRNVGVVKIAVVYALALGMENCWSSLMHPILSDQGISESEAGMMGFYATVASLCVSLALARLAEKYLRVMRWVVVAMFSVSALFFLAIAISLSGSGSASKDFLFGTVIVGKTLIDATSPILFELACELGYPIGEGMTTIFISYTTNSLALVFFSINGAPNIGNEWMNWTVVGAIILAALLLASVRIKLTRKNIDMTVPNVVDNS